MKYSFLKCYLVRVLVVFIFCALLGWAMTCIVISISDKPENILSCVRVFNIIAAACIFCAVVASWLSRMNFVKLEFTVPVSLALSKMSIAFAVSAEWLALTLKNDSGIAPLLGLALILASILGVMLNIGYMPGPEKKTAASSNAVPAH